MVRNYKRKTKRVATPRNLILLAVRQVKHAKRPLRRTARDFGIPASSLSRYCSRLTRIGQRLDATTDDLSVIGYCKTRAIFNESQERNLAEHVKKALSIHDRLSSTKIRRLAYRYAAGLDLRVPDNWRESRTAGRDWLIGFLKRHDLKSSRAEPNTTNSTAAAAGKRPGELDDDLLDLVLADVGLSEIDVEDIKFAEILHRDSMLDDVFFWVE